MNRGNLVRGLFLGLLLTAVAASGSYGAMEVFVSIPPQKWLVQAVGGEPVSAEVLVRAGQDPHTFEPTPRQVAALSRAKIWYVMGLEFEGRLVPKVQAVAPGLVIVDMSRALSKLPLAEDGHGHEEPGQLAEHEHEDAELDPHVWLSPVNLEVMSRTVADSLAEADPEHTGEYRQNQLAVAGELAELHRQIESMLKPYAGSSFFVFHPSFGYFAAAYGLVQVPVEIQGKSPSPRQLAALIAQARREQVKVIFVQPQFDPKAARAVADAIGGSVVPLDALDEDVVANLQVMAKKIEEALKK